MLQLAPHYQRKLALAGIETLEPYIRCVMLSSVTGQRLEPKELGASYWAQNMTSRL